MTLETTEIRTFEIRQLGEEIKSPKGHTWIECETDAGTVAFFGGKSTGNITALQQRTPPFWVKCGCRQPLPNYPTHTWWVPETSEIEFVRQPFDAGGPEDMVAPTAPAVPAPAPQPPPAPPVALPPPTRAAPQPPAAPPTPAAPAKPTLVTLPAASPFRALAREDAPLYVIGATKTTIWDDDAAAQTSAFVPAVYAYRGRAVKDWLASTQRAQAAHWLFLSPRYGFIEPDHPVARHEGVFSDRSIPDAALRAQAEHQRRWNDRVALREFQTIHVWSEAAGLEDRVRAAFEGLGAKVVRLKAVTKAK